MIASTREWFRRNRTRFAIGAGILGAGYLATNFVLAKVTETRQRMSDDRIARENLRRRFEQNQEDCTFTVLAILPTATENIVEALPVEQTLQELQRHRDERLAKSSAVSEVSTADLPSVTGSLAEDDGKSLQSFQSESYVHASQLADSIGASQKLKPPRKSKAVLWNEVKISSISRAFTLLYTVALLTLLTRIQLNLLGRRNYLASVVTLAASTSQGPKIQLENRDDDGLENSYGNDFDTNRKYLSFSWWLLHRGCKDIMNKVVQAVQEVFGPINPREELTLERLSTLAVEVRKKIEGATQEERLKTRWLPFLLPSVQDEEYMLHASGMVGSADESGTTSPSLRRLIDETSDLIDSPSFSHVLTLLLDEGFGLLVDSKIATTAYKIPPTSASAARVQEIVGADAKAKLANTLAVFCRQAHAIGSGSTNEYLTAMEAVKDLEAFAAVVYSSNFEFEAPGEPGATAAPVSEPPSSWRGTSAAPTPAGAGRAVESEDVLPPGVDGVPTLAESADFEKAWAKVQKEEAKK